MLFFYRNGKSKMRKCEALPGTKTELPLDLLSENRMGDSERGHSPNKGLLLQTSAMPCCLDPPDDRPEGQSSESSQANFPISPLFSFPKCPASSSGSLFSLPAHPWPVLILWFSDPAAGRPWSCASAQGEAQILLENSTLAEVLVDPAQPCPGWEF